MEMDRKEAGFVGLGLMGAPMAANLLAAGWTVTAWNRSPAALDAFEALGGSRVARGRALRDQPVIVFMLPDLSDIEDASAGAPGRLGRSPPAPGTAVVVMSSVSPAGVQDFGARVAEASGGNAVVVDAPVSGGTKGAADGTLAIMAGASDGDFRRLLPLFGAMGSTVRRLGPLGSGSLAKACNQLIVGTTTAALAEAAELAERSGMDVPALYEVLARRTGGQPGPGHRGAAARRQGLRAHRTRQVHAQGPLLRARKRRSRGRRSTDGGRRRPSCTRNSSARGWGTGTSPSCGRPSPISATTHVTTPATSQQPTQQQRRIEDQ